MGKKLSIENPKFNGFIRGQDGEIVLAYRQNHVHGLMPDERHFENRVRLLRQRHRPFPMTVTLRNGQKARGRRDGSNYVTVNGDTDIGTVRIKHPDPISTPLRLSNDIPNRRKHLSIQYLEFPGLIKVSSTSEEWVSG